MNNTHGPKNCRKKFQKRLRHIRGANSKCNTLVWGNYGMQAGDGFYLKDFHFEMLRLQSVRLLKALGEKTARYWCRVFPHQSFTKKPVQVRMGGGKPDIAGWHSPVKRDTVIYEWGPISAKSAKLLFKQISTRMPKQAQVKLIGAEVPVITVAKEETGTSSTSEE